MKTLAIIPARGESKRLPGKNLMKIAGRTLVDHAIDHALCASTIDRNVVLTTDDPEIATVAENRGVVVIMRPVALANDTARTEDVIDHAFAAMLEHVPDLDSVAVLQPTSPLRRAQDVVNCCWMLEKTQADAVFSVNVPAHDEAFEMRGNMRLHTPHRIVVPNGAIYVLRADTVRRRDWYTGHLVGYEMPRDRYIDIDTQADLDRARAIMERVDA